VIDIFLEIRRECLFVRAQGHSLFDKKGKDLVCCAVSTLIESWYLTCYELGEGHCEASRKDGFFEAKVDKNEKNSLFFRSLYVSLVPLQRQYESLIKLRMEEKDGS